MRTQANLIVATLVASVFTILSFAAQASNSGGLPNATAAAATETSSQPPHTPPGNSATSSTKNANILVLGDSLSAAYGIDVEQGWVELMGQHLATQKQPYQIINISISGETSGGGLARLPRALESHKPAIVIVELGANDGLRGYPTQLMRDNLTQIIQKSQAIGAKVLLLGIHIPPNYGKFYTEQFDKVYQDLAAEFNLPFMPFLLIDVAGIDSLMQSDGLHPNAKAQRIILDNVLPYLEPLL